MSRASKLLLTASLCLGSASSGLADGVASSQLWGGYTSASVTESRKVIHEAVDTATADLNFIVRSVARKRLSEVNPPYQRISLSEDDGEITIDFDGLRYVAPASGEVRKNADPNGERVDVTYRLEGNTLHGLYKAKDGSKAIDFTLMPDARTLEVRVQVTSPRLSRAVSYKLTYQLDSVAATHAH